jgi:hypothetical protein
MAKNNKNKKKARTSDKTFDRRAATAKAAPAKTTAAAIRTSTENKMKSGKIKKTGVQVWDGGDPFDFGGPPNYSVQFLNNREGQRVFDRTASIGESYYGDGVSVFGEAWTAAGFDKRPMWTRWKSPEDDLTGPRFLGVTVARNPYYATDAQWQNLREYFQEEQIADRAQAAWLKRTKKKIDHKRKTNKR